MSRDKNTENDADESDTDSSSSETGFIRNAPTKRSATVSPAARQRCRHSRSSRRRSDIYLHGIDRLRGSSKPRLSVEKSDFYNVPLRKTNSEPSVEQQQQALTLDAIRHLLDSYENKVQNKKPDRYASSHSIGSNRRHVGPKIVDRNHLEIWTTPRESMISDSEEELMNTDIEELRDAAESIQSLQRVLKVHPSQHPNGSSTGDEMTSHSMLHPSDSTGTLKGITTNLGGHPRGVMQFLPSAKQNQFQPTLDSYTWNKQHASNYSQIVRRKTSVPENYLKFMTAIHPEAVQSRNGAGLRHVHSTDTDTSLYAAGTSALDDKGVDSLAGINRFSKLLNSLRLCRQDQEHWQYETNLLMPPEAKVAQLHVQQSLRQADQLLWKRRSRASLRRHQDIRNMAVRELFETEKNFVENLEYIIDKYRRPLLQPLECTLIDPDLVDKIFYKIPEMLNHHQIFLQILSTRLECSQSDTIIGDVLLTHFTKQSMMETFMAFVDNFKIAKQAIWDARQRPAFEKYYMRCSREHRTKLDLDALLILPIQRVPRYELILKQVIKHTSVDHCDYENLLLVQQHVHNLATAINCQREEKEKMEQRLREIEAIVDGLEDLVAPGRKFIRYDLVAVENSQNGRKQRCIFMMSDQLVVTSICRKAAMGGGRTQPYIQSPDFLDNNRFKLLIKISLDDIDIGQDTIPLLQNVEHEMRNAQEDSNIVSKIIDLSKLIKMEHSKLSDVLEHMYTDRVTYLKSLQEQMISNPDLTTIKLQVTTFNGIEIFTIVFPNAEKRALWENAFVEAKNSLKNAMQVEQIPPVLKSILVHRSRQGLTFTKATAAIGKPSEGAPNIWVCASDKFSGFLSVVNVNSEPSVENSSNMGNSKITAIASIPGMRKRCFYSPSSKRNDCQKNEIELESDSSDLETSDSDLPGSMQSTVWIGNEDGEIYVFNYIDNVRLKTRERLIRLTMSIVDIVYVENNVYISIASKSQGQLVYYQRTKENAWDFGKQKTVRPIGTSKISCMIAVTNRLCFGMQNTIYLMNPHDQNIDRSTEITSNTADSVSVMASVGSIVYVSMNQSTTIKLLNAFTLVCLSEFSIQPVVTKTLSLKEDIICNHKLGNLRVTAMHCIRNHLWIGTSAGMILTTAVSQTKNSRTPNLNVCSIGHIGPCRFLTSVNISPLASAINFNKQRLSLNAPSLQQFDQIYVISGGNGIENYDVANNAEETGIDDACNHLIFWQL